MLMIPQEQRRGASLVDMHRDTRTKEVDLLEMMAGAIELIVCIHIG